MFWDHTSTNLFDIVRGEFFTLLQTRFDDGDDTQVLIRFSQLGYSIRVSCVLHIGLIHIQFVVVFGIAWDMKYLFVV